MSNFQKTDTISFFATIRKIIINVDDSSSPSGSATFWGLLNCPNVRITLAVKLSGISKSSLYEKLRVRLIGASQSLGEFFFHVRDSQCGNFMMVLSPKLATDLVKSDGSLTIEVIAIRDLDFSHVIGYKLHLDVAVECCSDKFPINFLSLSNVSSYTFDSFVPTTLNNSSCPRLNPSPPTRSPTVKEALLNLPLLTRSALGNWWTDNDVCSFNGVICEFGRVTEL